MSKKYTDPTAFDDEQPLTHAEKKRARKATQEQQIALEKQLVKEGKILPRTRYAPKGFLGRILAVLLSFLFGMFAVIGGLLGGGYYLAVTPSRNLLHFLDLEEGILSEEYLDKSIIDIVADVQNDLNTLATDVGTLSLGMFSKYTPVVNGLVDTLVAQAREHGLDVDAQTLIQTPVSGLADYLVDGVVMNAELGAVMGLDPATASPIILALCYGKEGSNEEGGDYQVVDGKIVMNNGKSARTLGSITTGANEMILSIPIESILDTDASSTAIARALCYGAEGVNYTVGASGEIVMLTDPLTGMPYPKRDLGDITDNAAMFDSLTIGSIVAIDENTTGILRAIKDWTIGDLADTARIQSLRLSQLISIGADSSLILQAMRDWRISDLTDADMVDTLTLSDILEIDDQSPKLLQSLADTAIGDFDDAIDELRLADILDEAALDGNRLLRNLKDSTLDTLASDVAALTVEQVFGDQLYSYLDMSANGTNGSTYADLILGYDPSDPANGEEGNEALRPAAMSLDGMIAEERRTLASDGAAEVLEGYFRTGEIAGVSAPAAALVTDADVRRTLGTDGAVEYYFDETVYLTPSVFSWQYLDYENGGVTAELPAGDFIAAKGDGRLHGYAIQTAQGVPYEDETGNVYYYCTTRVHIRGGAPAAEQVAYPLCEDDGGVYTYRYVLTETAGEDGSVGYAENSVRERVEFERVVVAYETPEGGSVRPDENGNIGYLGGTYRLRCRAATDDAPAQWWIVARTEVTPAYYTRSGGVCTLYAEEETVPYYIVGADSDGDGKVDGAGTRADRYLSGVWYLLFGDECDGTTDCTHGADGAAVGESHMIDNTDTPVLNIAGLVTAATETLNEMPLWKLWLHEFITANPYADLGGAGNLNMLTINGMIAYIVGTVSP